VDRYWCPLASYGYRHHSVLCDMMLVGSGVPFCRSSRAPAMLQDSTDSTSTAKLLLKELAAE